MRRDVPRLGSRSAAGLLLVVVAAACARHDQPEATGTAMQARLDAIDARLGAIEQDVATYADLKASIGDFDRRLSALEARLTAGVVGPAPTPPGQASGMNTASPAGSAKGEPPAGLWSRLAAPEGGERRAALAALGDEYRARKGKLDEQLGGGAPPAERQQALADLNQWYSTRLRDLLGSETWPPPSAQTK